MQTCCLPGVQNLKQRASTMKGAQQRASSSYSAKHAVKVKPKVANESIGKMTQFRNLDDIPDAVGEYDWESSETQDQHSPIDRSFDNYQIKSVRLDRSLDNGLVGGLDKANLDGGTNKVKIPPLPYDQNRPVSLKPAMLVGNNVPAPASKYFDYDHGVDDFEEDDQLPTPSPKKALRLAQQDSQYATSTPPLPAPPLPCDAKPASSDADSIYFSKKPRPVEFKPYTMKQYKMIQPKEYVEIPKIKPDLNREDLIAKRANLDRVKEFSRNLHTYNRQVLSQAPKLPSASEKRDIHLSEQKHQSNRQKALDFAKNVPKPKVAPKSPQWRESYQESGNGKDEAGAGAPAFGGAVDRAETRILELEAQHKNRKAQIEAIRKTMGLK